MWSKPRANPTQAISPRGAMERNLGRVQNAPRDEYWTQSGTSHTRKCMIPVSFSLFLYFAFFIDILFIYPFIYYIYLLFFYKKIFSFFIFFLCSGIFSNVPSDVPCSWFYRRPYDGGENVSKEVNLRCFKICCSYSTSFNFSYVGDFSGVEF